jgi:zinc protease
VHKVLKVPRVPRVHGVPKVLKVPRVPRVHGVRGGHGARRRMLLAAVVITFAAVTGVAQQRPDRSAPPPLGPAPSLTLPPVQKLALPNGLPVWIVEQHEVPLVQVNVVVRTGSSADPAGKFGLASLTAAMIDEGAGGRDALELADAFDMLGAQVGTTGSFDWSAVRMSVPVTRLGEALPLLADVVMRPDFPQAELERLREERLTQFLQARDDPAAIAQTAFPRLLFGPEHRFGSPGAGTEASVKGLTVEDLRGFHAEHFRPDNAVLLVVGDITAAEVHPLLEEHFGGWTVEGRKPAPAVVPGGRQPERRQVYLVDKPGAAQSQVRIGWVGVPRGTRDYFPIIVMNTVLGGSFTSRLNTNLRETHGYAYGAGSAFDMRRAPGPFFASAGVQTDKTAEALTEFFTELNGILAPMPADELDKARNYLALGFPRGFETTGDLARRLEEQYVYDLPDDYFSQYVERVQAVTATDVARVAKAYVQPDRFIVVVVGDLSEIEAPVRKLALGPVTVVPLDDVFE